MSLNIDDLILYIVPHLKTFCIFFYSLIDNIKAMYYTKVKMEQ